MSRIRPPYSGARYRQKPFLLLDDNDQFFVGPPHPGSLRAVYPDREMKRLDTAEIALGSERWEPLLRVFFARGIAGSTH